MIWSVEFWKGAGERAIKSFAQSLVVFVGADGVGVIDVDWPTALGVSVAYALASVLTSIGNADFVAGPSVAAAFPLNAHVSVGTVMDASERTVTKDLDRDYSLPIGPASVSAPAGSDTDDARRAAIERRAAKIARSGGV